jgi:RNA polymerase sigma-32 factor
MIRTSSDALSRYITKVRGIPGLSREEETLLARKWRATGDPEAARRLVEPMLRHVVAIAVQFRRYPVGLADLVAEGNVGLLVALRKFDPDRGTRFVTYAAYWIRAYVLTHVIRTYSLVGGGSGALRSKVFFRLRRERAKLSAILGDKEAEDAALAKRFGVPVDQVRDFVSRLDARDLSLASPTFDGARTSLEDRLVDDSTDVEADVARREADEKTRVRIDRALMHLDPRERFIVHHRILTEDEMSLAEIGRALGVSRERARQLEARAKQKLRTDLSDLEREAA